MSVTICRYGLIEITGASIRQFSQRVEYDATQSDAVALVTDLEIEGFIDPSGAPGLPDTHPIASLNPAAPVSLNPLESIKAALLTPRLPLELYFVTYDESGSATAKEYIFIAHANADEPAGLDVDRGPKPQGVDVHTFARNLVAVTWSVRIKQIPWDRLGRPLPPKTGTRGHSEPVLSNRWSLTESVDHNGFVTKTIVGQIRVAAPVPEWQVLARLFAVPPLERSFRRDSMEYGIEQDGVTVRYRIVDRQVHTSAPYPATNLDLEHTEHIANLGYEVLSECRVTLEGPIWANKSHLIARAAQLLLDRLAIDRFRGDFGRTWFLDSLTLTEYIGTGNRVSATMRIKRFPLGDDGKTGLAGTAAKAFWRVLKLISDIPTGGARTFGDMLAEKLKDAILEAFDEDNQTPPPSADFFQYLRLNLFGSDPDLPALPYGPDETRTLLRHDVTRSQEISPWGYTPWQPKLGGELQGRSPGDKSAPQPVESPIERNPAVIALFTCYAQVPWRPPHDMRKAPPWKPKREQDLRDARKEGERKDGEAETGDLGGGGKHAPDEGDQAGTFGGRVHLASVTRQVPTRVIPVAFESPLKAAAAAGGIYTLVRLSGTYRARTGTKAIPLSITASDEDHETDDQILITSSRQAIRRRVVYEAERAGDWPDVPAPIPYQTPDGIRGRILDWAIELRPPQVGPDGKTLFYAVRAVYLFALNRAPTYGEDLELGLGPHLSGRGVRPFSLARHADPRALLFRGDRRLKRPTSPGEKPNETV
ncbi:hypothetical protein JCM19992_16200 [Thermostilla marina]